MGLFQRVIENIRHTYVGCPNRGAPKYIKKILTDLKGEIDSDTIIVRDFSTPLLTIVKSSRQKINKTHWI